jgi:glycosyltransferase involved in cell wall biosynthesis
VLCTRGLSPSLLRCLDSLLNQECKRSEILLVLNGERDEAFAKAVSRYPVRLLNEPRRGVSAARNHAIPQARGEILAFVDDDVVAHANWLHELVKGFEDPKVACVAGRLVPDGLVGISSERIEHYYTGNRASSAWTLDASDPDCYQEALGGPAGFGCNMAFRKSFLENYARLPEDLGAGSVIGGCDEPYMFVQVLKHGFRIHHTPSAVVTHFFGEDRAGRKLRLMQAHAGTLAFTLKLLTEEPEVRWATLKWLMGGLRRRLSRIGAHKSLSSEPKEALSSMEKLRGYLRGPLVFWKSRRSKNR